MMRRPIGILLIILGVAGGAWCGVVGGSFSVVYLMGYIGTDGNEAGRELAFMSTATVLGIAFGWLLVRLGIRLKSSARTDD